MKKFIREFKAFATRGNVIDMAVGIIVGSAFTAIVTSLVGDIFTPLINLLTGRLNFSEWVITIGTSQLLIGNFIQSLLNFLLTAFCLFLIVRAMNRLHKKEAPPPAAPAEPSREEVLLTEIRDLLCTRTLPTEAPPTCKKDS